MNVPSFIKENIPLSDKNWFGTGGNARYFAEPTRINEFQEALLWATQTNNKIFVLGKGANILISDVGFNGLVMRPQNKSIAIESETLDDIYLKVGAGMDFGALILYCLEHNIIGLEEFSGIPGTVGGSVFINIHFFEFLLSQFIESATIVHAQTADVQIIDKAWFAFGYNYSTLHTEEYYLIDVTLRLKKVSQLQAMYAKGRHDEMIRYRSHRYPTAGTCGSFFRNFFEHEIPVPSKGKKLIYVAYYLDMLGIKGNLSCGDAVVSHKHANMIVNHDKASSTDIITLARNMQEMVLEKFGLLPQPECRLIGFNEYPLLPHSYKAESSSSKHITV